MAADGWVFHDRFIEFQGDNTINMDSDSFEIRLYTSLSNISDTAIGDATTATNEVSGNGYSSVAVTTTWNRVGAITTFDSSDALFTASGGSIVVRFAGVINTTTTPDEVVAHSLLDNSPADITITDGNSFLLQPNPSGVGIVSDT